MTRPTTTAGERTRVEKMATGMSDDMIRYQVAAHERQNDFSWTFDVYVNEYRKRDLTASGWRDAGEVAAGA